MLLKLGEAEAVHLLVSPQVLGEIEAVIRRKYPGQLPILVVLLDRSRVEIVQTAPAELLESCRDLVSHPGDANILADAWNSKAIFLATPDRAHLLGSPSLANALPFILGTPGDCLSWYRNALRNP
jgi:predicted nucleic acid-binding protein